MRRGFTLLEVLVASALLAMLVTILTMIFNQSSIAWTTGTAAVAGLGETRQKIAIYRGEAENAIFGGENDTKVLKVTSVWSADDENGNASGSNVLRNRRPLTETFINTQAKPNRTDLEDPGAANAGAKDIAGADTSGRVTYIVGVTSWGPDGDAGGWDNITTMPEEEVE